MLDVNRANNKKKKLANKKQFLKGLDRACISYHFNPACVWHYYINAPIFQGIHFWPTGIGRWYNTTTGNKGIGLATLLTEVKFAKESEQDKRSLAKPSFNHSKASTEARHRQRKIMAHYGMSFDKSA